MIEFTKEERQLLIQTVEAMNYPGKSARQIATILDKLRAEPEE